MKTKFTKGKWEVKDLSVMNDENKVIAQCHLMTFNHDKYGRYIKDEIGLANAKLIASAPEMFEMLKTIHLSFGGGNIITFSEKDIEEIQQLLTKITE